MSVATTNKGAARTEPVHSRGHATLDFTRAVDGRTFVSRQAVSYPFHITRPFYVGGDPEGMATVYLQSVSGGIYESDVLEVSLQAKPWASAHVTTQSACIVHGMADAHAAQHLSLVAREGALLEYWPDPIILFPDARLRAAISIEVAPGATVLLSDAYLAHDPDAGNRCFAELACEVRVTRAPGTLACLERFAVNGAEMAEHGATVGFANAAYATVLCLYDTEAHPQIIETLHGALSQDTGVYAGASMLPSDIGLCAKILAPNAGALNLTLENVWSTLRAELTGVSPSRRRK